MSQQSNTLIEKISEEHHIGFDSATDAEKIYIYRLVLKAIFEILGNDLTNIPVKSLRDILDALHQIENGFYEMLAKSVTKNIYDNVQMAMPMLIKALAHLQAALSIYNEGETVARSERLPLFYESLLNGRAQIYQAELLLERATEEQQPLSKEEVLPTENELSSPSAGRQSSQSPLSPGASQDAATELDAASTSSTKVNTIYLSSTYSDLKEHREAVYRALRRMHYNVIAMEDYVSTDQRPLEKCFADIAACDLYIGIFAWRYGYVPTGGNPDHKSITELEYRKARELGKPCLLFCLNETAPWPPSDMDMTTGEGEQGERIRKLRQDLASEHVISYFSSPEDLAKKVSVAVERLNIQISAERANQEAKLRALMADHRSFLQDRLESFVGRQAELAQIRQHIEEILQTGGYIAITGPNGQGKSSIIAKLVDEYGPEQAVYHFIPFNPGPDHQVSLLRNVMARLILNYGLPELYVATESRAALCDYFPMVLEEVAARGGREVIFIDGLDQLEVDSSGTRDLSFLPNNPHAGVVFVLGTRPNDTLQPLEMLKPYFKYALPDLSRHDFDLILEHRGVRLTAGLTDRLYLIMGGNALCLDLAAKELSEASSTENARGEESVLSRLAQMCTRIDQWDKAVALVTAIGDDQQRASSLGTIVGELTRIGQANMALMLTRRLESVTDRTLSLRSLAEALMTSGEKERAEGVLLEALDTALSISDADPRAAELINIIGLAGQLGDDHAEAILKRLRFDQDPRVRQAVRQKAEQPSAEGPDIRTAMVRILTASNGVIGSGFLLNNRHILTCAHVISQELGLDEHIQERPTTEVHLDFPFVAPGQVYTAKVVFWQPSSDVAGLQLSGNPPRGAQAAPLVVSDELWGHTFRAFGFPAGHESGVWAGGTLRGEMARGWIQIEDVTPGYRIQQGFSGAALWDEELNGVVGIVVANEATSSIKVAFAIPTDVLVKAWPLLGQYTIPPCPYRGLFAFREQDAPFFFGREAFIAHLLDALPNQSLFAVVGPPANGKSSVLFAGLIPRLRQEGSWLIISFRPGENPFHSLAASLVPVLEPQLSEVDRVVENNTLARRLQQGELALRHVLEAIVQRSSTVQLLLVVDQFEELYTLCRDVEMRRHFLDEVLRTVHAGSGLKVKLSITLRAEFLGQALTYRPFVDALQYATFPLSRMTQSELRDAIQRPAQKFNVLFEEGLIERILNDVAQQPLYLPITEYLMTRLWQMQRNSVLTHAAYDRVGDLEEIAANYFGGTSYLPRSNTYILGVSITPSQVSVGQLTQVRVELLSAEAGDNTLIVPQGAAEIYCFISADGFEVLGTEVATMVVHPRTQDVTPAHFELRARLRGSRRCTIELFVEDPETGRTRIFQSEEKVTVIIPSATEELTPMLPALNVRVPQTGLVLEVKTRVHGDEDLYELTYHLTCRLPGLQMLNQKVGAVEMSASHLTRLWAMVAEAVHTSIDIQPEDVRSCMLSLGTYLFDQIFPTEAASAFRSVFWQANMQATSWDWLIIHDEFTWLPWELVVPYREDDHFPFGFLCERYRMSQWVDGLGPKLYKEIPFGELALAHYKNVERGKEDQDDELLAWRKLLNAYGAYGISQVVRPETAIYGLHLLRHVDQNMRAEIVVRDRPVRDLSQEEVHQARLNLRLKRPLVTLSILDEFDLAIKSPIENWMLPERIMPFLRAGASALAGPLWPTCEIADCTFWSTLYDLLEQRVSLGEAFWRARMTVRGILPHRPDWLAYALFGNPLAKPYWPKESDGYATLECLSPDDPLHPGKTYTFRASISSRPPVGYQDRLVRTEGLPDQVQALFIAPRLQAAPSEPVPMQQIGRTMLQATIDLTPPARGRYPLLVQLLQGDEQLRTLQLILNVGSMLEGEELNDEFV